MDLELTLETFTVVSISETKTLQKTNIARKK